MVRKHIKFNVSVSDVNLKKRIRRTKNRLAKGSRASVSEIGRLTRDTIKINMPKSTGESRKSIRVVNQKSTKNYSELSVAFPPFSRYTPHPSKRWGGGWFNLPRWMLQSPRALNHPWRSGNLTKMRNVVPNMRKKFRRRIDILIEKSIK